MKVRPKPVPRVFVGGWARRSRIRPAASRRGPGTGATENEDRLDPGPPTAAAAPGPEPRPTRGRGGRIWGRARKLRGKVTWRVSAFPAPEPDCRFRPVAKRSGSGRPGDGGVLFVIFGTKSEIQDFYSFLRKSTFAQI